MSTSTDHISEHEHRLQKVKDLEAAGTPAYESVSYERSHSLAQVLSEFASLEPGEKAETEISVAGRIVAKRGHGKASFGNLRDDSGDCQYYAKSEELGEIYDKLIGVDVGDIIGIRGTVFCSKRGQITIRVQEFELLAKALNPLPEKFHGLQDKEQRYRQRYVDLIVNPEVKETFKLRSKVTRSIREFLDDQGYIEVETPVLQSIYGGASARPFETHHNELGQDLYLRIALELPLKRLIVGGFEKVFEIGRVFRNEGVSYKHNPEYTLLELYQAYSDYHEIMVLTETLISKLVKDVHGTTTITYQGVELCFDTPFRRVTLRDLILEHADIDIQTADAQALYDRAKALDLDVPDTPHKGECMNLIYDKFVEPTLIQPTFVMDYPWESSPLAKRDPKNPDFCQRFECIINGMELANAFSELNDPIDQAERFEDQKRAKEAGYDEAHEVDDDFVEALKYGMPPTGGLGIGIDRLVMLLADAPSIRDVIFFPHMKKKGEGA